MVCASPEPHPRRSAASSALPRRRHGPRAGADLGPALGSVARVQHDQAGIVDPAVGILEAGGEHAGLQRRPGAVAGEIEHAGAGQALPAAEVVVEEQAEAQHPARPQARL